MRELTQTEINVTNGALGPVVFVAAVALSKVSWTSVATQAGAMVGAALYAATINEA